MSRPDVRVALREQRQPSRARTSIIGQSEPVERLPTLEEQAGDIATVMDAVGLPRAQIMGTGATACPMAPTPHAVRERVARWGTMGRPPAGMSDAMTKHLIRGLRADHGQEVVDLDEPPLRLLLGSYALARAADVIERQSAEDRKWAFLSERTDFQEVAA